MRNVARSSGNSNGFTLGIKQPGQSWMKCMAANSNNYSLGGSAELTINVATNTNTSYSESTSLVTGNLITDTLFGHFGEAAKDSAVPIATWGAGQAVTYGRRTSQIKALNLAGKGGLPKALSSSGAKGLLKSAGRALNLGVDELEKGAVDLGFAGAEAYGCSVPAGGLVPW